MTRGAKVEVVCANSKCRQKFQARVADRKRGWGKFCSKSCKAAEQENRTHQHSNHLQRKKVGAYEREYGGIACFDNRGEYVGFMDHFSNEDHDCNKQD